jgi:hypothetical protein
MLSSHLHAALHEARTSDMRRAAELHRRAATRGRRRRLARALMRGERWTGRRSATVTPWPTSS